MRECVNTCVCVYVRTGVFVFVCVFARDFIRAYAVECVYVYEYI